MSKSINFVNFPKLPNNNNKSVTIKAVKPKSFVVNRDGTIQLLEDYKEQLRAGL